MMRNKKGYKKRIAFILPEGGLPIPAVMGGAIETLMTMLLEENEVHGRFQLIFIFSGEMSEKKYYKHAVCYECKPEIKINSLYKLKKKLWYKMGRYFPIMFPPVSEYYQKAYEIAKSEKADYIVAEGIYPSFLVGFLRNWKKDAIAMHIHSEIVRKAEHVDIYGKAIAVSQFIAERWKKDIPDTLEDTFILKNSVKKERFDIDLNKEELERIRKELGFCKTDFIVLYCGRLLEIKGVKELLDAVLGIEDKTVKLLIIGSDDFARGNRGEYASEVINLVEMNKNRVCYLGYIDNEQLYKYYKIADIQVVPSLCEEAAGLVAIEGMVAKIPLIVTDSGGMVEYVNPEYTSIITRKETMVEDLKKEIVRLMMSPGRRQIMSSGAYEWAKQFSSQKYYQDFSKIIAEWSNV